MTIQNKKYTILLGLLVLSILLTYFAYTLVAKASNTVTAAGDQTDESKPTVVISVEDAARMAGYAIKTIANVPKDFESPKYIEIWQTPDKAKAVMQIWGSVENGSYLLFTQDPSSAGIAGAKPYSNGNFQGQRLFLPADDEHGIPNRLGLYWRVGNMTYQLFGTLTGSLDENTMIQLTNSVVGR